MLLVIHFITAITRKKCIAKENNAWQEHDEGGNEEMKPKKALPGAYPLS